MFKLKKLAALTAVLASIPLFISACNGGGSAASPANSTVTTLPNGITVLPNGAQISTSHQKLLVQPGTDTKARLLVTAGSSSSDLGLIYTVEAIKNGISTPDNSLAVIIENPHLDSGSTSVSDIKINAQNAQPGNYVVHIKAGNQPASPEVGTLHVSVDAGNMLKAAYIQISATGSLVTIPDSGYFAPNILIFAFADTTTATMDPAWITAIKTAVNAEQSGALNFLSVGGQFGSASVFSNVTTVVNNIMSQISVLNGQLSGKKINGVDLDLEGEGWTASQIDQIAAAFKAKGLLVSTAPQAYLSAYGVTNVDPANPTNLGLTATGASNVYGQAVSGGNVDYVMVQTYNSSGWTVGGNNEAQVGFVNSIGQALNNTVKSSCTGTSSLCIKSGTKILIGEPSNASGGGYSIFNPTGASPIPAYNQANILSSLNSTIASTMSAYSNIAGVMEWSLNNDYAPSLFSDPYAINGAFGTTIFGATPPPPAINYRLEVTNTASVSGVQVMSITNGSAWIGALDWLAHGADKVYDSNSNPSVKAIEGASNLLVHWEAYSGGPSGDCPRFNFTTNKHIMINPETKACEIKDLP